MLLAELIQLTEGRLDPNVTMSLQKLVRDGKLTDTFQAISLARLLEFFKNGTFYKQSNFFDPFTSTSKELLDTLRNMAPEDVTALAAKLLELIDIKDKDSLSYLINPEQETAMWIKYVTSREAND
jgi:hypothetical protein